LLDYARRWLPRRSPEAQLAQARELAKGGQMTKALAVWTALAADGVPRAQTNLGACLATGVGVPVDLAAARLWLQRGAEAGDALGQRNLATMLLNEDQAAAVAWYRRAAEGGDAISQDQLSRMLLDGEGAPQDLAQARHWAEQAARQGVVLACARFATMCHEAKSGPRDPAQAVLWWRVAAHAGDADAAAMLGAALHMGQGVAADQVEAMAWLIVGSGRHSILVRPFFAKVEAELTPDERSRARALAAGWATQDRP